MQYLISSARHLTEGIALMTLKGRRHNEQVFRALIEHNTDAIALLTRDGTVIYASPSTERITGYTPEEFVGINTGNIVCAADWAQVEWSHLLDCPGGSISFTLRMRHKNGSWRWMEGTFINLLSNPTVEAIVGNYRDITERKLAEERLHESEERYRVLVEQASDGIFLTNRESYFVDVNAAFCLLSGYTREELLTKNIFDLARPEDHEGLYAGRNALFAGETLRSRWHMKRKDGSLIHAEFASKQLSNGYLQGIVHDITERIQAEQERARLLSSEQTAHAELEAEKGALWKAEREAAQHASHLTAVFDAITDGVMVCDTSGHILQSNSAFRALLGLDEGDETALTLTEERRTEFVPHDLEGKPLPREQWPLTRALSGERVAGTDTSDLLHRTPAGRVLFLNASAAPIHDAAGKIAGAVLVLRDVTERRQLERQRQLSERKYRSLLNSGIVGISIAGPDGKLYEVNDCLAKMFGYSREELLADDFRWYQLNPPGYNFNEDPMSKKIAATGVAHLEEKELVRKDGSRFPVLLAGAAFDREQKRAVMMCLDISERKEVERRKQEFLGMVSHELRSPLTAILGFIELAQFYLQQFPRDTPEEKEIILNKVETVLSRTNQQVNIECRLVEALLDVARMEMHKFELSLQEHNLVSVVREVIAYQQQLIYNRRIELLLPAQKHIPVLIDEDRIGQVFINYLTNAHRYSPANKAIVVGLTLEGKSARVFVRDQGPGLTPEQQPHIWERFYQAESSMHRGSDGGLGLGLYIVKIIIQQHGGQVGVESEPGQGATFWFTLPLTDEPAQV
jgi:PAS domain S-box-containing protein